MMIRDGVVKKPRKGKSTSIVIAGSQFKEVMISPENLSRLNLITII